jgi:hypothetical protein
MSNNLNKEEEIMKRVLLSLLCFSLLVFALSGVSYGWQGRMGGAGDPYGLLQDESDFLIHPAKIANGEGIKFYGHYRFTYTDVTDWDYDLDWLTLTGALLDFYHYNGSGQEYSHNALLGAATPLGPGRFGIFFTYDGMRGDYDGDEDIFGISNFSEYDLSSDFDSFALRLLYGLPIGGFNLGGEVQFAHRQEKNESWVQTIDPFGFLNYTLGMDSPDINVLPFLIPYDSSYWEALFKGSLEGMVGPLDLEFTLRGGFIFGGDNNFVQERDIPVGTINALADLDGDVTGWLIGGDLWLRYALANDLILPFLVRIDYQSKARDADGPGQYGWSPWTDVTYETEEKGLHIVVGGGVNKELGTGTKIAAGIYYNYLQGENRIEQHVAPFTIEYFDSSESPDSTEHQVMLRLAGELGLSPEVTLRMGLTPFFGWVGEDYEFTYSFGTVPQYTDNISLDGYRWGIGASLGGSVQFDSFTLEPFINGGWQQIDLDGDGEETIAGFGIGSLWGMDLSRDEWYIGGGCSFLYDLP